MKLDLATKVRVNHKMMKEFMEKKLNVLLIGEKGTGKTQVSVETAQKLYGEENVVYMSAPTLDVFTDLIGIPVDNGGIIDYIRPRKMHEGVRVLIIDELNRAPHQRILNALLELIQFRSINGIKYPNLQSVIACVNPPNDGTEEDDEFHYHVIQLDQAHIDRFHIILQVPNEPDRNWFVERHGKNGEVAVDWWKNTLGDKQKAIISPRRLDMALNLFPLGVNLEYVLGAGSKVNSADLVKMLSTDELEKIHRALLTNPTEAGIKKAIKNLNYWHKYGQQIMENSNMWRFFAEFPEEQIQKLLSNNREFRNWLIQQSESDAAAKILENYQKIHKKQKVFDAFKKLKEKGVKASKFEPKRLRLKEMTNLIKPEFKIEHTFEAWPDMSSFEATASADTNPGRTQNQDVKVLMDIEADAETLVDHINIFQNMIEIIEPKDTAALNTVGVWLEDGKERQLNTKEKDWLLAFILCTLEENVTIEDGEMEDQLRVVPELLKLVPNLLQHRTPKEASVYRQKLKVHYRKKYETVKEYAEVIDYITGADKNDPDTAAEIEELLK